MVVREVGLMPFRRQQELDRHDLRALVDELHEGVLAVGARLSPDHGPRGVRDRMAVPGDALAVRFHVELLQMRREPRQPLVVGQHGPAGVAQHVAVPDPDQPQHHGEVGGGLGRAEMLVHGVRAGQELAEALRPDRQHQRQTIADQTE